jgi:N utilization substance protein A
MPTKRNANKSSKKSKKRLAKRVARKSAKQSVAGKKALRKKAAPKKKAYRRKKVRAKKGFAGKRESVDSVVFEPKGLGARSGGQSGDLQGLSNIESAASQSVDELLEEGNSFEAEIVKGIQDAPDADQGEIRTHEVPEDDVPQEYLDRDE